MTADSPGVALDSAARAFVGGAGARMYAASLPADVQRAAFAEMQRDSGDAPVPPIIERWATIAAPGGAPLRVRIVEPLLLVRPSAAVLYLHGGGWVSGDAATHDRLVRELAVRGEVAVVFPEYSRSPEARHPVAVDQAYATARWLLSCGAEYGLDPTRLAVAGDSEGAALALAVTLKGLQDRSVHFRQLVAFTPVTDADFTTESYRTFAEGYGLRRDAMRWYWDQYAPAPIDRADPTVSPLRADSDDLARFPPTLIITAEADVVRDEGEAFAARLRAAGAVSAAVRYEGTVHDFVVLSALQHSGAARAATAQAASVLREALVDADRSGPSSISR